MSNLKRFTYITVSVLMVVWMTVGMLPVQPAQAAASAGSLIKMDGNSAVYYFDGTKRFVFPNQTTYMSWYPDFSGVLTIPQSELQTYPIGGNVTMRAGTWLVKITTDPKVYAVTPGGVLHWVDSEAKALSLYGSLWNKMIVDVSDAFFVNYSSGATLGSSHPEGSLIKYASDATIYYIDATGTKRPIASEAALAANMFQSKFIVTTTMTYGSGTSITGAETALKNVAGSSTPVATGAVTVSLAASTPASSTLVATQSVGDLAHFTLTNGGSTEVKVTSIAFKRTGVSGDTTLSAVYLFDGATRLTDAASVSSSVVTFNDVSGIVTLPAGGSKTLAVKSDILTGTSGQTVGVQIESAAKVVTSPAATITGVFPMSGNIHTIAQATLAAVSVAAANTVSDFDPGTDINLFQSTVTVSTRDVTLNRFALRQIGSIANADINNFRLYVDGVVVSTVANLDSNSYVTFAPNVLVKSGGRIFKVVADVIGGSSRTIQMSLRGAYDLTTTDSNYNVGKVTTTTSTFPLGSAAATINPGTLSVQKATDSPSSNLVVGASDVAVAKYTFTAYGEAVKVETLSVGVDINGTDANVDFRNGRVMVDGSQVGSTTDISAVNSYATGTAFTTNFTVYPGTPRIVEIRSDMVDSDITTGTAVDDIAAGTTTTPQFALVLGSGNGVPQVSLTPINVPTGASVAANSLTIASGTMALASTPSYPSRNTTAPQTAYKLASFDLSGNATEAVNLNTIAIGFVDGDTLDASDDLTNVYVKYGTKTTTIKGTVSDGSSTSLANSWSITETLPVSGSMTVEVYGNIGSGVTAASSDDLVTVYMRVTGVTAGSTTTVYADTDSDTDNTDAGATGQTITVESGTFTVSKDATAPAAKLLDDSGTQVSGAWKFETLYDAYTITDVTFTIADVSAVSTVTLMQGVTPIASKPAAVSVTFSGMTIPVTANNSTVLTTQLTMAAVGVGGGTTGSSVLTTLTSATGKNSSGVSAGVTEATANPAGNAMYTHKSVPTISNVALPTSVLAVGTKTISKFTIATGGGGTIAWAKIAWTVTKNIAGTDTLATAELWDVTSGAVQVTGAGIFTGSIEADNDAAGGIEFIPAAEQLVSGSKTYELRVVVAGAPVAGNSITAQIAQPSTFLASTGGMGLHAASSLVYYDVDNNLTPGLNDIRVIANVSVASAYGQANTGVATFLTGDTTDEVMSYGTVTNAQTIIMTETGAATNIIGALTGSLIATGGFTCAAYDAANGGGTATTTVASILSVKCTNATTTSQVILNTTAVVPDAGVQVTTITLTSGTYAAGSTVAAADSDAGLVLPATVLSAASFVWSDVSKASHTLVTTDWTNGYLVPGLATDTQSLQL